MQEYDGCSDFLFEAGTQLLLVYPPDDGGLKEAKGFIEKHGLTSDEVKIVKSKNGISVIAKIDVTLTLLHEGSVNG